MQVRTNIKAGDGYGSFEKSCDHIAVDVKDDRVDITAWCNSGNGSQDHTSITVPDGYTGDIANCYGTLTYGGCS